jgi:cytochrome c oxidase cbb3-type subunit 1
MQSNAALEYDYSVAKLFTYTTILFGFLGMLIGTLIAAQLAFPEFGTKSIESIYGRIKVYHVHW